MGEWSELIRRKSADLRSAKSSDSEFDRKFRQLESAEKSAKNERRELSEKSRSADEHFLLTEHTNARHKKSDVENKLEDFKAGFLVFFIIAQKFPRIQNRTRKIYKF